MTDPQTLRKIQIRIQNLIVRADDPGATVAEAQLCRQHIERLMREYRVTEEEALAVDPHAVIPVAHGLFIADYASDFNYDLSRLIEIVARHSEVKIKFHWGRHPESGHSGMWVTLVGFEVDLSLAEYIYASARLAFGNHLEPRRDDSLSEQVNVYRMRAAGMLRKDIAEIMWGSNTPANRSKAQRLYKKECEARGELPQLEGLGTDAKTFRESYARSFVDRVSDRLRIARDAADVDGGVVVFAGRAEKVREAFYEMFPEERPQPLPAVIEADEKPLKPWKPTKADIRRTQRRYYSDAALSGGAMGSRAAEDVDIRRPGQAKRIED